MILEFEKALLTKYIPQLVPGARDIKFSRDEGAFYWDFKFNSYPSVLAFREDASPAFTQVYNIDDYEDIMQPDGALKRVWSEHSLYAYTQPYTIRVFLERQSEMINVRNHMALYFRDNPYVVFTYDDDPNFRIGMRLLTVNLESNRDNNDAKGAQRCIALTFQSQLVLKDTNTVPSIEEVNISVSLPEIEAKAFNVKVVREADSNNIFKNIIKWLRKFNS